MLSFARICLSFSKAEFKETGTSTLLFPGNGAEEASPKPFLNTQKACFLDWSDSRIEDVPDIRHQTQQPEQGATHAGRARHLAGASDNSCLPWPHRI
jgi:hypothetical protein